MSVKRMGWSMVAATAVSCVSMAEANAGGIFGGGGKPFSTGIKNPFNRRGRKPVKIKIRKPKGKSLRDLVGRPRQPKTIYDEARKATRSQRYDRYKKWRRGKGRSTKQKWDSGIHKTKRGGRQFSRDAKNGYSRFRKERDNGRRWSEKTNGGSSGAGSRDDDRGGDTIPGPMGTSGFIRQRPRGRSNPFRQLRPKRRFTTPRRITFRGRRW